ncbi:MAG: cellulase family glycosylhydrolase, partial [Chloroflexales bacterium]|nr:cellulase family glycosylhydrolase [Chloroflexales bacterium]
SFPRSDAQPGCRFFAETGQNACAPFLAAWRRYGLELGDAGVSERESLALFGLPLSPAQAETLNDGRQYTVQWFERARFEDHGAEGVLLGLLGRESQGNSAAPAPAAPQPSAADLQPGGFIKAEGDKLTRLGQSVQIKGVNYYPQGKPWAEMWEDWKGQQIQRELQSARADLGINTLRVLVPYSEGSWKAGRDGVNALMLGRLREMVQIAGALDMRLIVSLFDFENIFPTPGSREEADQRAWLKQLVGNFAGDDRIIAWDIHNEPDNYKRWQEPGGPEEILTWTGRMADLLHEIAPNHLVTVGVGHYETLWRAGPDGRRMLDYSDVISFHTYNAADTERQIYEIRSRSPKPILLEEFGWPTGPRCSQAGYDEATQAETYRQQLQVATGRVAGVVAWTLRDYDAGPTARYDTREEHYGLYRADGSLKPAAAFLRAYDASPLPAATRTSLAITETGFNRIDGPLAPKRYSSELATAHIKGYFRRAFELFGAQGSFGVPLSEAYVRPEDGRIIQYFSAGLLAYFPEAPKQVPDFALYNEADQVSMLIRLEPLGARLTGGRSDGPFARVSDPGENVARYFPQTGHTLRDDFRSFYNALRGTWRLGLPISEEFAEPVDGRELTVQYFERGRLERDGGGPVRLGALGLQAWQGQCRAVGQ